MTGFFIGMLVGAILWAQMFPQNVVKNDIEQNIKKVKDSPGTNIEFEQPETTNGKPKRFLGILWKKKLK